MNISRLKESVLELLYPTRARCLGCGDERGLHKPFLCEVCRAILIPEHVVVEHAVWKERYLSRAAFAYYYGRPVRGMIKAFKYKGVRMLAGRFAKEMDRLLRKRRLGPYDMIVPVPLHSSRLRERGFNQAQLLAEELSALCGIPVRSDLLIRSKKTRQQAKLSHEKREENLSRAFKVKEPLDGLRILVLDDVITTGSTVCACAEALHDAGAADVQAISIAGMHSFKAGKPKWKRLKQQDGGVRLSPAGKQRMQSGKTK